MRLLGRFIFSIIELFFITYSLNTVLEVKYKVRNLVVCILLYLPCFFFLETNDWKMYVLKQLYLLLIYVSYLCKRQDKITQYVPLICVMLNVYGIIKVLIGVLAVVTVEIVPFEFVPKDVRITVVSIGYMLICITTLICFMKNRISNYNWTFSKKCMACFLYFFVVFSKIPFLYTEIQDGLILKMVFVTIICCTIIFFIISRIERHNAEMERAKIEENNKKLSTKLHKSQEIIPAVVQILNDVTENSGKEMEEHETQKLLTEMTDLFGQQLKQNSKEDLQLKNFCSTGLIILDQQLKVYQMEAIDRGVNFDIYVQAPINELIKRDNIDQMKLQRALGDLIRNAFRAIERNSKKCRAKGHILLIIGCRYEGILEIAVVDNGEEFPLHVIEAFGKRGVTSWGTGNGLADMVEFAQETKASICVEEFDGKTNSFTKKVSMIFDKCRKNYYNSVRKELIESSFWEKIEYL